VNVKKFLFRTRGLATAGALASVVLLVVVPSALAGKPGGGGKGNSSISLVLLNGDTEPHFGGSVTFNVSTTATDQPWVNVSCYQNGAWVYGQWQGFFPRLCVGADVHARPHPVLAGRGRRLHRETRQVWLERQREHARVDKLPHVRLGSSRWNERPRLNRGLSTSSVV
jgi:hypothetical protein